MRHCHETSHGECSCVERNIGCLLVEDEAMIDERIFCANRECFVCLNTWKFLNLSCRDVCLVQREILGGTQSSFGALDRGFPTQIEIAAMVSVSILQRRLVDEPVVGDAHCSFLALFSRHGDLIFSL